MGVRTAHGTNPSATSGPSGAMGADTSYETLTALNPAHLKALLGQEVVVTLGDTSTRTGIVYNVDPVNFSVALLKVRTDRPTHKSKLPFHGTRHYHGNRGCRAKSSDCLPV